MSHLVARRLFLRLLGAVNFVAFASLAVQVTGLIGERGILPAAGFLLCAYSIYGTDAYRLLPTLLWLDAGNTALVLTACAGAALGILLVLGVAPILTLTLLWALFLSLVVAEQDFLSFQWDALLLETTTRCRAHYPPAPAGHHRRGGASSAWRQPCCSR